MPYAFLALAVLIGRCFSAVTAIRLLNVFPNAIGTLRDTQRNAYRDGRNGTERTERASDGRWNRIVLFDHLLLPPNEWALDMLAADNDRNNVCPLNFLPHLLSNVDFNPRDAYLLYQ